MKNIETPDSKHLAKLISELRDEDYVIPDFQRDFVWEPWDISGLIRSIFEDYYIGTLLLWRSSKDNQDVLSCKPIYGSPGLNSNPSHIVLDGQQRLTSLYYAFFAPDKVFPRRKNKCHFFINLKSLIEEHYEDAVFYEWPGRNVDKLIADREEQFKRGIFPTKELGEKSYSWLEWVRDYQKYWEDKSGSEQHDWGLKFEQILKDIMDSYDLSYIELDRNIEVSKVCDIFTRINSTGVNLSIFDLMNAILRPKEIRLKDEWHKVSANLTLSTQERMRLYLLQTMSILKQGYCSANYIYYLVPGAIKKIKLTDGSLEDRVLIATKDEFMALWHFTHEKMKDAIQILTNSRDYGAIKSKYVPYPTMLPILTAVHVEKNKAKYKDKGDVDKKIKRWYWSSIFTKNYSSSVESQMATDYQQLKKWFADDTEVPKVISQFIREVDRLDLINEINPSSAIYKAVFNILISKGAKDWVTYNLPEYSALEDHHIVPKSWGLKNNLRHINSVVNRVPLSDSTNKEVIGDRLPNDYLIKMLSNAKDRSRLEGVLRMHLISDQAVEILLRDPFTPLDFEEFLKERQDTIKNEIKSLIDYNPEIVNGFIKPDKPYSNKLQLQNIILDSKDYLYWIDKYFSKVGLDILAESFSVVDQPRVTVIKILTSIDKVTTTFRKQYKDFREELSSYGIDVDMRVIVNNDIKREIHDRWIISNGKCFNIPSTDTIAVGQYSEIKKTTNIPPFPKWWDTCLDILADWNQIQSYFSK